MNKNIYLHVLQGNYGGQWDDLTASESIKEVRDDLKAYRENEGGEYRLIERREVNPKAL